MAARGKLRRLQDQSALPSTCPPLHHSQVEPRELFLVPLPAIEDFIQKLKEGTVAKFRYEPGTAQLVPQGRRS